VAKQKDGRATRSRRTSRRPNPPARNPAIGGVLALLAGAGARLQLTGTGPA